MSVLVAYASVHGSTREIAERIVQRLGEQGVDVQLCPAPELTDLAGYSAFIVGSAIHGGDWLPEGRTLLKRHRADLAVRPVWLFSISSVGEVSSAFPPRVARWMSAARKIPASVAAILGDIHPRDHHAFAGVIRPGHLGLPGRVFMTAFGGRFGDHLAGDRRVGHEYRQPARLRAAASGVTGTASPPTAAARTCGSTGRPGPAGGARPRAGAPDTSPSPARHTSPPNSSKRPHKLSDLHVCSPPWLPHRHGIDLYLGTGSWI